MVCNKFKEFYPNYTNGDLFMIKKMLYDQIEMDNTSSMEVRLKALSKLETIRYAEFRELYGMV